MALEKQLINIDLTGGIDTETDASLVLPGKLLTLQDAHIKGGRIWARDGVSLLVNQDSGGSVVGASQLATRGDELLAVVGEKLYSYAQSLGRLVDRGYLPSAAVSKEPLLRSEHVISDCDQATTGNISVLAYRDATAAALKMTVRDESTGTIHLYDSTLIGTGVQPRCLTDGAGNVWVVNGAGGNVLQYRSWTATAPSTVSGATLIAGDFNTALPIFDAKHIGNSTWLIAYWSTAPNWTVITYKPGSGVQTSVTFSPGAVTPKGVSVLTTTDGKVQVAWTDTSGAYIRTFASVAFAGGVTTTIEASATVGTRIAQIENATNSVFVFYEFIPGGTGAALDVTRARVFTSGGTATTVAYDYARSVGIATMPWMYDGELCIGLSRNTTLQGTIFVMQGAGDIAGIRPPRVVARCLPGNGGGTLTSQRVPQTTTPVGSWRSLLVLEKGAFSTTVTPVGVTRLRLTQGRAVPMPPVEYAGVTYFPSASPTMYDGVAPVEHGFHYSPEYLRATSAGAGSVPAGTRQYCATFEWVDALGNLHRSAPSIPSTYTNGGATQVTVDVETLRLTEKQLRSRVKVAIWRTVAAGTVFYRATTVDNSTATELVTVTDNMDDATLISQPLLYTTGGILENAPLPGCRVMGVHQNRLFCGGGEDETVIAYTHQRQDGVGLSSNGNLTLRLPTEAGACNGLISYEDKLFVLGKSRLMGFVGAGPNAAGQQNGYADAQGLTLEVGCQDPRSVVLSDVGVWFKSAQGFRLLDRSLVVSEGVGHDADGFASSDVTSAVLIPDQHQIRWTSSSNVLVYDTTYKQWSVFGYASSSAVWWGGKYVCLWSDGAVMQEARGTPYDTAPNGSQTAVSVAFVTSWLKMNGVAGFQRVSRLLLTGEGSGTYDISLNVAADLDESMLTDFAGFHGTGSGVVTWRHHLANQKCSSVRFTVTVVPSVGALGFNGISLALEAGVKRGGRKTASS